MAFPPNSCSARARWLLALWKRAGGKARARRRCRHSHLGGGPDPASAARGGPRPRTGPCVQRLPSGEACFLWKMKRAGTLRSAVPLPNNRPRPGPGHPQAECPPNWLRAHLLGPCRGAATLPPGVLGHPAGCPAPGGPAWLRGEDFPLPPSPRLQPTPPATAGMQAKGSCHPAATCHPVPPLCPVPRPRR